MAPRDGPLASIAPLRPVQSRAAELTERLAREITSGRLTPGARLPTEQDMMGAFRVSRTVVREAVAALRSEGLVETRQGVGAFVTRDVQRRPFRIDPGEVRTINDVLGVMELRMGVEIEAAGLAARRATAADRSRLERSLRAMDAAFRRGDSAIDEDFEFHLAIARAARNAQFERFLAFLGRFIIPRQSIRVAIQAPRLRTRYLDRIQAEHHRIFDAIAAGDAAAARRAMRQHLEGSLRRYERFAKAMEGREEKS
jgi:DNA-binding FadR family transcriptional regulator